MAKNKQVYTLQIDAELGNLQSKLTSVKSLLAGVLGSENAPKGLDKTLTKIEGLIDRVRAKASQPIDSKAGFSSISKDVSGAQIALAELLKVIQSIHSLPDADKLSFLPPDAQAQIGKIISSLSDYASAIEAATTETAELVAARDKLAQAEEKVAAAQAKVASKQGNLDIAKQDKESAEKAIAAIEERKRKLEELKEEQKSIEEFYKGTDEAGNKRNRSKKYEGARMRPQDISKEISKLESDSAGDAESLTILREQLKAAKSDITSYIGQLTTANRVLREAEQEQKNLADTVATLSGKFEQAKPQQLQSAYESLKKEAEELGVSLEGIGESYSDQDSAELIRRLTDLKKKGFEQLTASTQKAEENIEDFGDKCKGIKDEVDAGSEALAGMNEAASQQEAFENKIKQFLGLSGAAQVLRSALRDAIQTISELDATMTEMAVVTDLTVGDYWDQLPEYSKQASDLGVSINSAYKAATLYYQQGLKGNEVTKISAETLKMAKIAGLDAADATDKMTAALRGFNMELNETSAQRVSDVYSELAAITAADVDEISNAMTKTASIAHSAGMEFETTAAFLSQIIETTRESAETAGTALKTVIARFQELKKDPAEIGEVDGEIVDANKIETALRSVGVALRDSQGQFRELDDVFLELSSKWNGLDKNTQRYIATIAAGSRQQSRFIAMMSDYSRTQELVASANNSAGASQKQFEKTTESLEYKVERLKNAWHEFTMGIMNSDLLKFGVDILSKFLEIVNKATSALDGVGGSLAKIISVVAVFKLASKVFGMIKQPLVSFFADVVKMSREEGEKAGKAFDEGARKGATQKKEPKEKNPEDKKSKSVKSWIGDKTGVTDIKEGITKRRKTQGIFDAKKKADENFKNIASNYSEDSAEYIKAQEEMEKATKDYTKALGEAKTEEEALLNAGKQGFDQLASGMQKAGQAAMGLGMAVSMVGGALSSAGFEEAGNAVSTLGNWIMIAGAAITAIIPIINLLGTTVTVAGTKMSIAGFIAQAGWWWVLLIVAGIALLIAGIVAIYTQIQNNSPEKKLEKAQKAAEGAAQGAERAAEAYNNLNDSLSSLEEQQKVLEGLTRGTDEWNKAMQDVNSSVLDLIDKYPELAGFVENEGGVLTLDVDSSEVKDVLNAYKQDELTAKGASIGAKAGLSRANVEYDLDKMDDKVFEKFQTSGQAEAIGMAALNLGVATVGGAASGAAIGAGTGAIIGATGGTVAFPGIGTAVGTAGAAGIGALWGAIIGGITGLTAGIATFQYTVDQVEKNNEQNRENVKELAQAYASGEAGTTQEEIAAYIERNGIAVGDAAMQMANSLIAEAETMREFGETLNALDEQEKAYYQAMAVNAQQLIDLGSKTEKAINQINTVVDEDLMKNYEDEEKTRLKAEAENKNGNFEKEKENFAKSVYGEKAKVQGNQILDEKGEVVREFTSNEDWINEMAAANATLKAAEAMEQIPGAILSSIKNLEPELQKVFSKAFEGKDLTKSELEDFSKELGTVTYKDENGNVAKSWSELDEQTKGIWGSEVAYLKSLDADYSGIDEMWKNLTLEQKKAYGWDGTSGEGSENYEKAKEAYEATFVEIADEQKKAFQKAEDAAERLGITLSSQLSSVAAQAWTTSLEKISLSTAEGEVSSLNNALNTLLSGMSTENAELIMAEINAMDKMDIEAWDELAERFDELNIDYNAQALQNFANSGKLAYNAIQKINFDSLANDINNIYKTIEKTKNGARTYNEQDYKEIIAANKSLETAFAQIGDEFIFVGGKIEDLTKALEEGTIDKLNEANRQLKSRSAMSSIIYESSENYSSVDAMDDLNLMTYLTDMRDSFAAQGWNVADFGIAGLSNTTDFSKATTEQLRDWASAIALEGGKSAIYEQDYTKGIEKANIQRYTHNQASYNALQAAGDSEFAEQHQEALILQAIQSGGVSNDTIEAYRKAIESGNKTLIAELGQDIATQTDKIVEASEDREAYKDLVDRVIEAIEAERQQQIDKLADINDSINTTNQKLVDKMQEQINWAREREQLSQDRQNITDMYSQMAYLGMDTSGANALEIIDTEKDIEQAEKTLQETLVDQAIQNLSDANEKAAEQRDKQISILEQSLECDKESGRLAEEANAIVEDGIIALQSGLELQTTEMYKKLFENEGKSLRGLAAKDWASDLQTMAVQAQNWYSSQGIEKTNTTGSEGASDPNSGSAPVDKNSQQKANAIRAAKDALSSATGGGYAVQSEDTNSAFYRAYNSYKEASNENLSMEDFAKKAVGEDYRKYDFKEIGTAYIDRAWSNDFNWEDAKGEADDGWINVGGTDYHGTLNGTSSTAQSAAKARNLSNNAVFKYGTDYYVYHDELAYKLTYVDDGSWKKPQFKTGGLADFTGPAWLDGTKSRPEYVLNSAQTERFFSLIDVLEKYDADDTKKQSGDNYFEIEINVEKLENDYDVEQVANKIRKMIYEDAMYRNVNAINNMR